MSSFHLATIGAGLPVAGVVDALAAALAGGRVVLQAPPGTGKTTLVPPLVANLAQRSGVDGRVVVTQPRRIAARAAARRLAQLDGSRLGEQVGFVVRGESRTSRATRVEFCTTGILVRRLLADPGLDGVAAVVLDEVHERHLDADLAFAMVRELCELRPELLVVVMSATLDAQRWAELLGGDEPAPVVQVEADLHPLEVRWEPAPPGVPRLGERGVTHGFLDHLARVSQRALASTDEGSALVFVPGAWEAEQVAGRLRGAGVDAEPLFGGMAAREQDAVLAERLGRRVIVATSVAESSLTVPGVRVVVDAGLARERRFDSGRGMGGLVTLGEARSSAEQRAGRAARLGPGLVVRCFPEADWARMRPFTTPEILTADLTEAALALACWGSPGGAGLALPDAPPAAALQAAIHTLQAIGALDGAGRATAEGRAMARIPADPRLARALLVAAPLVGARRAAEVVAMLSGDERAPGGDLAVLLRQLRSGASGHGGASDAWRHEVRRLERLLDPAAAKATGQGRARASGADPGVPASRGPSGGGLPAASGPGVPGDEAAVGLVVALAHPDRIAHRRPGEDSASYLLTGGTGVVLEKGSALRGQEWLAVAEVARGHTADPTGAVVRQAVPITREVAERAAEHLASQREVARWEHGRVTARRVQALGAIELSSTPVPPSPQQAREAVLEALREQGLGLDGPGIFSWPEGARTLRNRLALLHRELGESWPDVGEAALLARADEWLAPELDRLAHGTPAARIDLTSALRRLLPWPAAGRLDELAPERIEVPTGSRIALHYPDDDSRVVLAVKLQECFGLLDTPRIADGRVPVLLHLLSPARRPLAVTDDLASFWANAYPAVRAENRGRYPKHPWPDDPLTAPPRGGTTRSGR